VLARRQVQSRVGRVQVRHARAREVIRVTVTSPNTVASARRWPGSALVRVTWSEPVT
jgi:hypothetical protein